MALHLYNTLTRSIEEFHPLVPGTVRMYTCGPTVYDYFHIGNGRTFVMADMIRRYLAFRGYSVTFVMNITDIDDKIIRRAQEQDMPADRVAATYTQAFLEDIEKLGIHPADLYPKATEHMDRIVEYIAGLIEKGLAYPVDGDVYYHVPAFPAYGKLSGKKLEDLIAGARVETDERKKHPADFALWKAAKPGEPAWPSPWGEGRPGWHIECSVMSQHHLGTTFDIHAGGNDLIFPHHENEIAQSEGLTGCPFAHTWLHFGFLNIDNEKMSKSLGNFRTVRDVTALWSAPTLRFLFLQTHYRSPLNFTEDGLMAAQRGVEKIPAVMDHLRSAPDGTHSLDIATWKDRFIAAVDHDCNFPAGLGIVFEFIREVQGALQGPGFTAVAKQDALAFLTQTCGEVFGILPDNPPESDRHEDVDGLLQLLITVRARVRQEKLWPVADLIRDGLKDLGYGLEDGKDGTTWKRERR